MSVVSSADRDRPMLAVKPVEPSSTYLHEAIDPSDYDVSVVQGAILREFVNQHGADNLIYVYRDVQNLDADLLKWMELTADDKQSRSLHLRVSRISIFPWGRDSGVSEHWEIKFHAVACDACVVDCDRHVEIRLSRHVA